MEFKGTKGRWIIYNESEKRPLGYNYGIMNKSIFEVPEKDICSVWHDKETGIEALYNAKLISKAPEMLFLLNDLLFDKGLNEVSIREIKILIKQATEI